MLTPSKKIFTGWALTGATASTMPPITLSLSMRWQFSLLKRVWHMLTSSVRKRCANTAEPSPSPERTAPGAIDPSRKISTCSSACVLANSRMAARLCALKSTWHHRTSTCATRSCTASCMRPTIALAMPGASTPCTTSRTGSPTRWRASPTPCARWNTKTTARFMTGFWISLAFFIRSKSNSPA